MENINMEANNPIGNGPCPEYFIPDSPTFTESDTAQHDESRLTSLLEMISAKIDIIISNSAHIIEAVNCITDIAKSADENGGSGKGAEAVVEVAKVREETNQQALKLLEKMYNDMKPKGLTAAGLEISNIDVSKTISDLSHVPLRGEQIQLLRDILGL